MTRTLSTLLVILILVAFGFAQGDRHEFATNQAVMIPQTIYVSAIIYQPDCPLKIERASLLQRLDGRRLSIYDVQNLGTKTITSFSVAVWNSNNTGDLIPWSAKVPSAVLASGQRLESSQVSGIQIVPLTATIRAHFKFEGDLRGIVFFLVTEVEFSGGSKYNGMAALDSLENHLKLFETKYRRPPP